jgi:hypothetical protein
VDWEGNIYMGLLVKTRGDTVPPEIRNQLTGSRAGLFPFASGWYGSIVKFKPSGGTVYYNSNGAYMMGPVANVEITGQEWVYYGASIQNSGSGGYFGTRTSCMCFAPRFDVDRFSRVIFPNVFQNEYICLDANKNLMFKMHNRDFLKDSVKVGTGAIVQATDKGMYVSDGTNNQVLCFSWAPAAEETLSIPVLGSTVEAGLLSGRAFSAAASPNPFSGNVSISVMGRASDVAVYDISGRLVKGLAPASVHGLLSVYSWDGRDSRGSKLRNGFYFYKAVAGTKSVSGRLTLLK